MISVKKLKNIYYDKVIFHFFLNSLFVVLSYFIANKFSIIYGAFFALKGGFLLFSFFSILNKRNVTDKNSGIFVFMLLFTISLFFSNNIIDSITRAIPYVVGFVYINTFVNYLLYKYEKFDQILYISFSFFLIYSFPIIMTLLNLDVVVSEGFNIYGKESISGSTGFLSNNLGWSTVICIGTIMTMISNYKFEKIQVTIFISLLLSSLFVLLISGSRSGILCLFLILITFFTKDRNVYFKFLFIFLFIGIFFFLSNSEFFNIESTRLFDSNSSGIEIDKEKEYRIIALNWLVNYYNENIHLWFTGIGFNQLGDLLNSKVIFSVGEFKVQGDIHNSYFQFLFENGLITFGAFMFIYILPSILNFLNSQRLLYFYIPAMVIPYFENNLNAGQFLFFPFVFSFIYLSNKNKFSGAKKYGN